MPSSCITHLDLGCQPPPTYWNPGAVLLPIVLQSVATSVEDASFLLTVSMSGASPALGVLQLCFFFFLDRKFIPFQTFQHLISVIKMRREEMPSYTDEDFEKEVVLSS